MRIERVLVTPELATTWLEHNDGNRYLGTPAVAELANAMLNGTFKLTHQPIAITPDGRLLDGQHRLSAVVLSGQSVWMTVAYDADPDTFDVIDAGKRRSAADVLGIRTGYHYAVLNSATARTVAIYDRTDVRSTSAWNTQSTATKLKLDRATLAELQADMADGINDLIHSFKAMNPSFRTSAPFVAACYVIVRDSTFTREDTDPFFRGVVTGEQLTGGDPRAKLRDALLANTTLRRLDPRLGFNMTVKAWNYYVEGRTVSYIRFTRYDIGLRPI